MNCYFKKLQEKILKLNFFSPNKKVIKIDPSKRTIKKKENYLINKYFFKLNFDLNFYPKTEKKPLVP